MKPPPLHHALSALTFGRANDIQKSCFFKQIKPKSVTNLTFKFKITQLKDMPLWHHIFKLTQIRFGRHASLSARLCPRSRHYNRLFPAYDAQSLGSVQSGLRLPASLSPLIKHLGHSLNFFPISPNIRFLDRNLQTYCLISNINTGRQFQLSISASITVDVGSIISMRRLCVLISNCSRDFLLTCGDLRTANLLIRVGKGNRTRHLGASFLHGLHNRPRALINQFHIKSTKSNPNFFACHCPSPKE